MASTAPTIESQSTLQPNDSMFVYSSDSDSENLSPSASSALNASYKVNKRTKKRDPVWQHARKAILGVEPRTVRSGKAIRACWYCRYKGCEDYNCLSTVAARNHLSSVHNVKLGRKPLSQVAQKIQTDISTFTTNKEVERRAKEEQIVKEGLRQAANPATIRQALLRLIVHHDLPLSFVEWPEVHTLVNAINYQASECIWTSHQTTANRVSKTFNIRQQQLQQSLQQSRSLIHLTTDTRHSPNNKELQAITAHFVDINGKLQKALLALPELDNGHRGEQVAPHVIRALEQYQIKDKVGYITADNHGANDTMCNALSEQLDNWQPLERRLRCIGHIINLAVQSLLFAKSKEAQELATQDLVAPSIDDELQQLSSDDESGWIQQLALQKILRFVTTLGRNDRLFNAFKRTAGKAIRKPVVTRWNSYYVTFEDALELRAAFTTFVIHNPALSECELSVADWQLVEQTTTFLQPFKQACKQCEGDYVTLDKVQYHMDMLRSHYAKQRQRFEALGDKAFLESIVTSWYAFDKYYSLIDTSGAYSAAILLHPAGRKSYLQAAWSKDWVKPGIERARQLWLQHYKKDDDVIPDTDTSNLTAFDQFKASIQAKQRRGRGSVIDEFDRFIETPADDVDISPLQWWLQPQQQRSYPQLSRMAVDVLSAPAMSAESERVFSGTRRTIPWTRARLSAPLIQQLECVKHWQRTGLIDEQFIELEDGLQDEQLELEIDSG